MWVAGISQSNLTVPFVLDIIRTDKSLKVFWKVFNQNVLKNNLFNFRIVRFLRKIKEHIRPESCRPGNPAPLGQPVNMMHSGIAN